jgi:hypothetical protein
MPRIRYRTDVIILNADPSRWKGQLHRAIHRRRQRGWQLVACLAVGAEQGEGCNSPMKTPSAAVTCLFRYDTRRSHGLRRSNGPKRMSTAQ